MKILLNGLGGYWPLHEASGSRYDLTGYADTLTDTNTVTQNPGIVDLAAQFTAANSERLALASNANVQTGDIDFTLATWVYLDSKGAARVIASKFAAGAGQSEYNLRYLNTSDRFEMNVFRATDSAKTAVANNLGAPALATWYFITAWHDSNADTVNIEANASGLVDSIATTGALQVASTGGFSIGALSTGAAFWDGRICEVGFWKRLLTQQERQWLYNRGRGRTFPFDGRPSVAVNGVAQPVSTRQWRGTGVVY